MFKYNRYYTNLKLSVLLPCSVCASGFEETVTLVLWTKVKRTASRVLSFLEKVFLLLMGCSKNYIMYWGLRMLVYHAGPIKCAQSLQIFIKVFVAFTHIKFFYALFKWKYCYKIFSNIAFFYQSNVLVITTSSLFQKETQILRGQYVLFQLDA